MDQLKRQSDRASGRGEGMEETVRARRATARDTADITGEEADPESHIVRGID
ncbi:hypothetical protein [Streptomyces sp. ISL-11]|uniref:hypothetical protein n=1 Tax=Streptomyces sp. ISL-11 TaxID=2819174 RepID=UPI001BE5A9C3|nr:hypothetical protein [Streptomyces sp. ISL-11]MBT2387318.1 hypothetical protein [Streptomyces sp. ISL-11]